ncbi:MAG: DNA-processing protein DprA [Bacteroidota bacterium]
MEDELIYKIGIGLIQGIGSINAKKLIAYTGGIEAVFKEKKEHLMKIPGIGKQLVQEIKSKKVLEKAHKEVEYVLKNHIKVYFYTDPGYPGRLKNCPDGPVIFYFEGNVDLDHSKSLGIVGTRSATFYGRENTFKIVKELKDREHDALIVSGLAYGIDAFAHKAALDNGLKTIAVLGHGLNTIYPSQHRSLAEKIKDQGGLVTEFSSTITPDRGNFVRRNRVIAGLSDAIVVVESAVTGGALITAEIANSYNRDVFAFPGKIKDKYSVGCNKLIKANKAALIEGVDDIEYLLGWDQKTAVPRQTELFIELSDEESLVLTMLKEKGGLSIDLLMAKASLPMSKISPILLNLELSGLVKSLPGKIYEAY